MHRLYIEIILLLLFFSDLSLFAQNNDCHNIDTTRYVAEVIRDHSLQYVPLSSSDYHQTRAGLQNSHIRFERDKEGRVAFLGGSITYNSGWRDSICAYFESRFPETEFDFISAGIPSMGTTPAAFRLERDVLSRGRVDLLFEEAAVNDATNGRSATEQIRAMEGIIRHCRSSNPEMDIVMMHFVDQVKISSHVLPEKIDNYCFDKGYLLDVSAAILAKGWSIDPLWSPKDGTGTRPNYVNVPMLIGNETGGTLKLKFEGNTIGIAVAAGKDAGIILYQVDYRRSSTCWKFVWPIILKRAMKVMPAGSGTSM